MLTLIAAFLILTFVADSIGKALAARDEEKARNLEFRRIMGRSR